MAITESIELYNRMNDPDILAAVASSLTKRAVAELDDSEGTRKGYALMIITKGVGLSESEKYVRYLVGKNPTVTKDNMTPQLNDTAVSGVFEAFADLYGS